ncbi:hypothetical protein NQ315_012479, partial [Exocentrus adspersus]
KCQLKTSTKSTAKPRYNEICLYYDYKAPGIKFYFIKKPQGVYLSPKQKCNNFICKSRQRKGGIIRLQLTECNLTSTTTKRDRGTATKGHKIDKALISSDHAKDHAKGKSVIADRQIIISLDHAKGKLATGDRRIKNLGRPREGQVGDSRPTNKYFVRPREGQVGDS